MGVKPKVRLMVKDDDDQEKTTILTFTCVILVKAIAILTYVAFAWTVYLTCLAIRRTI